MILLTGFHLAAQNQRVSGTVTGPDGQSLGGATVTVSGTNNGVITGSDGRFTINAPANATLEVAFYGMVTQQEAISGRTTVNITMTTDAQAIDEVIVIGYGSGRVGTSVGSVTTVKAQAIENRPTPNVMDAIQGKVAGLQLYTSSGEPTAASSIRLHGVGSLEASSTPLILLDGAPIDTGVMTSLNPNDIETMSVLKDASATSIYGSRAANGVIYITSKKGRRNQDAVVSFNAQYGISRPASNRFNMMSGSELAAYQLEYGVINQTTYDEIMSDGYNTNWRKALYDMNAPMYQVDMSVSGGSEKSNYFFSGMVMDQKGTDPASGVHKYSLRMNVDTQAKKWLKMGLSLNVGHDRRRLSFFAQGLNQSSMGSNAAFGAQFFPTYARAYDDNGDPVLYVDYTNNINPAVRNKYNKYFADNTQLSGVTYVQVTPVKDLNIKSQLGGQLWNYIINGSESPDNPYGTTSYPVSVTRGHRWDYNFTYTNTIDYRKKIGGRSEFSALVGHESVFYKYFEFSASRGGQTDSRMMTLDNGSGTPSVSDHFSSYGFNSVFGRAEYVLDDKYTVDASVRYDASSRFGRENRGGTFWAVGAGWNMKREAFLKEVSWINSMKFKATYGTQGNAEIGDYASLGMVNSRNYGDQPGIGINTTANPNLGWETQKLLTIGFNTGLWNDRLTFSVDWYNRVTKDMLMEVPFPATSGYASGFKNVGGMYNRGIDVEIAGDVIRTKDWVVNLWANVNYNKNRITEIFNGYQEYPRPNYLLSYTVGRDGGEFYCETLVGIDPADGRQMWAVVDPETGVRSTTYDYNQATAELQGKSRYAPWSGGFGLSASWKGISLDAQFSWNYGKYMINNDRYFTESDNNSQYSRSKDLLYRWKKAGDQATLPKYGELIQFDSHLMEDASFLRLKGLTVSYTLPKNIITKTGFINGLRVYLTGRNLFTVTKYTGFDPEADTNLTYGRYPNSKQYVGGIQLTF